MTLCIHFQGFSRVSMEGWVDCGGGHILNMQKSTTATKCPRVSTLLRVNYYQMMVLGRERGGRRGKANRCSVIMRICYFWVFKPHASVSAAAAWCHCLRGTAIPAPDFQSQPDFIFWE